MQSRRRSLRIGAQHRHPLFQLGAAAPARQLADALQRKLSAAKSHGLLRERQRVAQGSVGLAGDLPDTLLVGLDILLRADVLKAANGVGDSYPVKGYVLAARAYSDRHLVGLGRRQKKYDVRGRLLQRLQQRVEGGVRKHMNLVYNVDLV